MTSIFFILSFIHDNVTLLMDYCVTMKSDSWLFIDNIPEFWPHLGQGETGRMGSDQTVSGDIEKMVDRNRRASTQKTEDRKSLSRSDLAQSI